MLEKSLYDMMNETDEVLDAVHAVVDQEVGPQYFDLHEETGVITYKFHIKGSAQTYSLVAMAEYSGHHYKLFGQTGPVYKCTSGADVQAKLEALHKEAVAQQV